MREPSAQEWLGTYTHGNSGRASGPGLRCPTCMKGALLREEDSQLRPDGRGPTWLPKNDWNPEPGKNLELMNGGCFLWIWDNTCGRACRASPVLTIPFSYRDHGVCSAQGHAVRLHSPGSLKSLTGKAGSLLPVPPRLPERRSVGMVTNHLCPWMRSMSCGWGLHPRCGRAIR